MTAATITPTTAPTTGTRITDTATRTVAHDYAHVRQTIEDHAAATTSGHGWIGGIASLSLAGNPADRRALARRLLAGASLMMIEAPVVVHAARLLSDDPWGLRIALLSHTDPTPTVRTATMIEARVGRALVHQRYGTRGIQDATCSCERYRAQAHCGHWLALRVVLPYVRWNQHRTMTLADLVWD